MAEGSDLDACLRPPNSAPVNFDGSKVGPVGWVRWDVCVGNAQREMNLVPATSVTTTIFMSKEYRLFLRWGLYAKS